MANLTYIRNNGISVKIGATTVAHGEIVQVDLDDAEVNSDVLQYHKQIDLMGATIDYVDDAIAAIPPATGGGDEIASFDVSFSSGDNEFTVQAVDVNDDPVALTAIVNLYASATADGTTPSPDNNTPWGITGVGAGEYINEDNTTMIKFITDANGTLKFNPADGSSYSRYIVIDGPNHKALISGPYNIG